MPGTKIAEENGRERGTRVRFEGAPPHGGSLVDLFVPDAQRDAWTAAASRLYPLRLDPALLSDVELLSVGAYSPLTGFLGARDFESVLEHARLADGTVWPIPIVLPVEDPVAFELRPGQRIALWDAHHAVAIMDLEEIYTYDPERYAQAVFGTSSPEHPAVARLRRAGRVHLAGRVHALRLPDLVRYPEHHLDPRETRQRFAARGWRTVVGFQTRNPIHRAHEFIMKAALEIVDGLLVHPLVGETKSDDVPADVRMRCYEALLRDYYPSDRTLLAVFPGTMRYAGPREAVFHALVRKNYGCTHFIVGRDHAGVGSFYGSYDAQRIFDHFLPGEIGIEPLAFEHTFYCRPCEGMASVKTCPHGTDDRVVLSGTKVRELLRTGQALPREFTRPEIARILVNHYAGAVR